MGIYLMHIVSTQKRCYTWKRSRVSHTQAHWTHWQFSQQILAVYDWNLQGALNYKTWLFDVNMRPNDNTAENCSKNKSLRRWFGLLVYQIYCFFGARERLLFFHRSQRWHFTTVLSTFLLWIWITFINGRRISLSGPNMATIINIFSIYWFWVILSI